MKTIIAGSRSFEDYTLLEDVLCELEHSGFRFTEIVSGGAKGADALGERYASEWSTPLKIFPADWDKHKKAAGPIRNRQMAQYSDALVAFWDGKSRGTDHMIKTALNMGLFVKVVQYEN